MNRLVEALANIVREKVREAVMGDTGKREARFIFHGPPLQLLEAVFEELARQGGIVMSAPDSGQGQLLPVLLQLPTDALAGPNPAIGKSGRCDESHLLHIRNDPNSPSFVALVPPGQHSNKSVSSTTEEFGLNAASNMAHATFDQWWSDGFIQTLAKEGLAAAGIAEDQDHAMTVIEKAAEAFDDVDRDKGSRQAAWRLMSRIYSIPDARLGLAPGSSLALACGVPPKEDGSISKQQSSILEQVADEMADGFKTGLDRLANGNADQLTKDALAGFLAHVQRTCDVPTAFERATQAFYLAADELDLQAPPAWWARLTAECWSELLAEQSEEPVADVTIACTNAILPVVRSMPAIVRDNVEITISVGNGEEGPPVDAMLSGGSRGKVATSIVLLGTMTVEDIPPVHRSPVSYKVDCAGRKPASTKVIALESWAPGIIVTSRMARKLSVPKKPRKSNAGADWETSISLPGSGRYELLLLTPLGAHIYDATSIPDDATEYLEDTSHPLRVHRLRDGEFQVEIEADGKYQLEVSYQLAGRDGRQTCRAYIVCEEAREEGCRSEFERLIKSNRQHLEKFGSKLVVQLDRHPRSSSLQSWMLDEQHVARSYLPLVIADDYTDVWAQPDWNAEQCPILSKGRFLHDPRPQRSQFQPPRGFLEARADIAERIRQSTDDQTGLVESAPLGKWLARDGEFHAVVEAYLDAYISWLASDPDIACWVDAIAVCALESTGRTLARTPDAIILSPLHPVRLAWHCLAQRVLHDETEGDDARPCPAASILDPDCIPDLLTMSLQSPGGAAGIDLVDFVSVECNSDYWSVLWNGSRLELLADRSRQAPFDSSFGLTVGGIANGFSPAQVARALEDVTDLLAAKPIVGLVVSSAGGGTDACNEGLASWCTSRFGNSEDNPAQQAVGPRVLEVYDVRPPSSRPDPATIANISEDTGNNVRWFDCQPADARPDLGIVAQLDSTESQLAEAGVRSPLGAGGLIRHRVRRQLHGAFLSESRQGRPMPSTGDTLLDKVASSIIALEGRREARTGLQFAPNVHAVSSMLNDNNAGFVAVSSSAIDPACFLGGWMEGTYLWDYDLPSYSHRAGDTTGYYLLSQVRDADREALARVLRLLPGGDELSKQQIEDLLLEVARRGIPTVRGLSGDDTGATGDLGLFLAARLLQDQFRRSGNVESLLPVLSGSEGDASLAIIIPVDPFRGYLADLARSLGKDRKEMSLSRPDLLVVGVHVTESQVRLRLTPVEVKCRLGSTFREGDAKDALDQAKALSSLFRSMQDRASKSVAWRLAFQHLLLSMVSFGLRVYSQHELASKHAGRWASYHERIAAEILSAPPASISVDNCGRLVVVDSSPESGPRDHDCDGLAETIVIATAAAGRILCGDAQGFYHAVRSKVGDWSLLPRQSESTRPDSNVVEDARGAGATTDDTVAEDSAAERTSTVGGVSVTVANERQSGIDKDEGGDPQRFPTASGIILSLGNTVDGFEPRQLSLNISDTRLNQLNIGVVGDLGTGKTQLLKSLILQLASAREENRGIRPRFLIFDYKRDYSSPEFVAATGAKVVRPNRLPLNLFDTTPMGDSLAPWLDRFRFFADVLDKVYSGIGPVQRDKLKGAVRNAYESCSDEGRQPTIYDIHAAYKELLGGKSDSPMAIIDDLVDMEVFEREPSKTKTFDEFLDGVVVISLDAMGQDDRSKNMLVAIMLNMFYENMLRTPKRPFEGKEPQLRVIDSYLLVDEADNIMRYEFDVLRKLLLQGREFGAGIILASQYLRHFKASATDYREPLLTWFIHKVPNVTAAELGNLGFTSELGDLSERVKTLPNHHCLYKSFDISGEVIRGLPFYELVESQKSMRSE